VCVREVGVREITGGETRVRDVGILVFVFGPLDAFFRSERTGPLAVALLFVCGLLFIALGIMLDAAK
jgi:hypothetical protein